MAPARQNASLFCQSRAIRRCYQGCVSSPALPTRPVERMLRRNKIRVAREKYYWAQRVDTGAVHLFSTRRGEKMGHYPSFFPSFAPPAQKTGRHGRKCLKLRHYRLFIRLGRRSLAESYCSDCGALSSRDRQRRRLGTGRPYGALRQTCLSGGATGWKIGVRMK